MKLRVVRDACGRVCSLGKLYIDNVYFCETLEDPVREVEGVEVTKWKIPGYTAIPRGEYVVTITHSAHFGRRLPLLNDVPGYAGVRIHPGNDAGDTEGCLLVGKVRARDRILTSREVFDKLFARIEAAAAAGEAVTISIE